MTSPWLFTPKSVGATFALNALTKYIGGHGNALAGSITDTGLFDWTRYPNILDSYKSGDRQIGALGVTHSWELDCRIIESVHIPVIIAGGLGPENVREAIRSARPAGVDSKTKTDKSDGSHTKDLQKVSAFVAAARSLDQDTIIQPRETC